MKASVKAMWPTLIHYGSTSVRKDRIYPVKNRDWVKPDEGGGLWTSPVDSDWGWANWCKMEEFRVESLEVFCTIELKDDAKLYVIDSLVDLLDAPSYQTNDIISKRFLDFEKLAEEYDGIWLTDKGENATRYSDPMNLYSWDVETVLLFNGKCIK